MRSGENNPINGNVHIDEFVVGEKETGKQGRSYSAKKKKVSCAVELTESGKVWHERNPNRQGAIFKVEFPFVD